MRLVIIGDGPEKAELTAAYPQEDVRFLGKQDGDTVLDCMSRAMYVMVPSIWYEGFPMTIVESFLLELRYYAAGSVHWRKS